MRKYERYKNSGTEWVKEIPEHWEVIKGKWIFKEVSDKNHPEEPLLSVTQDKGVYPRDLLENRVVMPMGEVVHYKLVQPNDFVISLRSFQGGIEYSQYRGLVSPAYVVLRAPAKIPIHYGYFKYLMKSPLYIQQLNTAVSGIRQGKNIAYKDFGELTLLFPPLNEQKMIADYLDKKLNEIDLLIEIKEKQIELFKEKQRKIIDDYILNGINHKKTKKVDEVWLASIPEDWHLIPLKHIVQEINISRDDIREDEIYLSLDRIESKTGKFKIEDGNVEFDSKVKEFKETDILFNKLRPYLAKVVFPKRKGVCVGELLVLRPKVKTVLPEYLHYVLLSPSFINLVDSSTYGTKMPRANWGFIGNQKIPIPRKIEEQKQIVELIKQRTQVIDDFIKYTEEYIAKIKEYRQTLISNVVTGRFNICHLISKGDEEFANGYVGA